MKSRIADHYVPRINDKDPGYQILDWESAEAHLGRFQVLVDTIELKGSSLLDIGCGVGDLYGFLEAHQVGAEYTGLDILPEMTDEARRRHPAGRFVSGNLFDAEYPFYPQNSFDVLYSSGVFNLNLGNNQDFLRSALPILFKTAKKWVVFNLLATDHPVQSDRYVRFDAEEVISWIKPFSSEVKAVHEYVPHDFTLICKVSAMGPKSGCEDGKSIYDNM